MGPPKDPRTLQVFDAPSTARTRDLRWRRAVAGLSTQALIKSTAVERISKKPITSRDERVWSAWQLLRSDSGKGWEQRE